MAPGCTSVTQQQNQQEKVIEQYENKNFTDLVYINMQEANNNQIPLPSTPPPNEPTETAYFQHYQLDCKQNSQQLVADTVDSFEILEQTIMKQKRMAKMKNTDLRLKVLLKRTFNLVCEIMDHENGFDTESNEDIPGIEINEDVRENFGEEDFQSNDNDSGDDEDENADEQESDSDSEEDEDELNGERYENTNTLDQMIPIYETKNEENNSHQLDSISQIDFQTITLNQFNYVDYDNQSKSEHINFILSDEQVLIDEAKTNDEQYISLEPIVTFFEQQSGPNKRKLNEEIESDICVKRFKLNRSLSSSSDEENDTKYALNRTESNTNSYLFNNLTNNDLNIKSSRKDETNIKIFKLSSINFYA